MICESKRTSKRWIGALDLTFMMNMYMDELRCSSNVWTIPCVLGGLEKRVFVLMEV